MPSSKPLDQNSQSHTNLNQKSVKKTSAYTRVYTVSFLLVFLEAIQSSLATLKFIILVNFSNIFFSWTYTAVHLYASNLSCNLFASKSKLTVCPLNLKQPESQSYKLVNKVAIFCNVKSLFDKKSVFMSGGREVYNSYISAFTLFFIRKIKYCHSKHWVALCSTTTSFWQPKQSRHNPQAR